MYTGGLSCLEAFAQSILVPPVFVCDRIKNINVILDNVILMHFKLIFNRDV